MGPSGPTSSCQPYRPALGPSGLHDFVFHAHQADDHHVSHLVHLLIGHLVTSMLATMPTSILATMSTFMSATMWKVCKRGK